MAAVIERYADTVVFLNGWEYSEGCGDEFLTAVQSGANALDENLAPLQSAAGRRAIEQALGVTVRHRVPTPLLTAVAERLERLAGGLAHDDP